jgi:hypothetical protein
MKAVPGLVVMLWAALPLGAQADSVVASATFTIGHDLQYAEIPKAPPVLSGLRIVDRSPGRAARSSP